MPNASEGKLVLLNPQTGLVSRRLEVTRSGAVSQVAVANDLALVGLATGDLVGIHLRSGQRELARAGILKKAQRWLVAGNYLVVVGKDGTVSGFTAGGDLLWETEVGPEYNVAVGSGSDAVVLGSSLGAVTCLEARTGAHRWKTSLTGMLTDITAGGNDAFFVAHSLRDEQAVLVGIAAADGAPRWELTLGPAELTAVHIGDGLVAASSPSRGIVVLKTP